MNNSYSRYSGNGSTYTKVASVSLLAISLIAAFFFLFVPGAQLIAFGIGLFCFAFGSTIGLTNWLLNIDPHSHDKKVEVVFQKLIDNKKIHVFNPNNEKEEIEIGNLEPNTTYKVIIDGGLPPHGCRYVQQQSDALTRRK